MRKRETLSQTAVQRTLFPTCSNMQARDPLLCSCKARHSFADLACIWLHSAMMELFLNSSWEQACRYWHKLLAKLPSCAGRMPILQSGMPDPAMQQSASSALVDSCSEGRTWPWPVGHRPWLHSAWTRPKLLRSSRKISTGVRNHMCKALRESWAVL